MVQPAILHNTWRTQKSYGMVDALTASVFVAMNLLPPGTPDTSLAPSLPHSLCALPPNFSSPKT